MNTHTIEATANATEKIAHLGSDGFILFAILIVFFMFVFMGYVFIQSQKRMNEGHNSNALLIQRQQIQIDDLKMKLIDSEMKLAKCLRDMKNKIKEEKI